jgi:integrase
MRAHGIQSGSLFTVSGQRKYLTAGERARFLEAAHGARPALCTLCLTLAWTGCRISEALALTPDSIDGESSVVVLRSLKKRGAFRFRQVPVPEGLIKTIEAIHAGCEPHARLWPWSRSRAWQLVKLVMGEAAIGCGPHATPKGLRHAFGLHAIRSGVPLNLVQRWLGHASMNTTAIYLDAIGAEEREIASRMWVSAERPMAR